MLAIQLNFHNQLCSTLIKYLRNSIFKKERFILPYNFREFSLWLFGHITFWSAVRQYILERIQGKKASCLLEDKKQKYDHKDLTSFHQTPPPKGSTIPPCFHGLESKPSIDNLWETFNIQHKAISHHKGIVPLSLIGYFHIL